MRHGSYHKAFFALTVTAFLLFIAVKFLWGFYANYNRFNPVMDYVPQEMGSYDTTYWDLTEGDCRSCGHGDDDSNDTAGRHHATETALLNGGCEPCHFHEDGPAPLGRGVVVRDCTTSGCHSWDDVPANGWHHDTDEECVICHRDVVDEIEPFRDLETDPPTALDPDLIPNPFSCDNCHWEQDVSATGDPDWPGHPSTYDHDDGQGFHEYATPIRGSADTHHMGFKGPIAADCSRCHGKDPNKVSWDPYDKKLIRYCETCHSFKSLHVDIRPHMEGTSGWEAVGFHVLENNNPTDVDPVVYRTRSAVGPYIPEAVPGFSANEMCLGCHWIIMPESPEPPPSAPVIDITTAGIQPNHGCCGVLVALRGDFFGDEHGAGYRVQMKPKGDDEWHDMPVYLWTDTVIRCKIPCKIFSPGNYKVRVMTPAGNSNRVNFILTSRNAVSAISPAAGPCDGWITLSGIGFGSRRSEMSPDGYNGVHHVVDVISLEGTYSALNYTHWSDNSIKVKLDDLFADTADPHTGQRNFVQDDGSGGCSEEPTINGCDSLPLGVYSVSLKAIYFGDEDASGHLSCGDTIFQVVVSDPVYFELVEHSTDEVASAVSPRLELKRSGGDGCCFISTALELTLRPMFRP
jgi:hypothetical protein